MRSTVQEARPAPPLAKEIEHWPLNRLIPYARNARTHSDTQLRKSLHRSAHLVLRTRF